MCRDRVWNFQDKFWNNTQYDQTCKNKYIANSSNSIVFVVNLQFQTIDNQTWTWLTNGGAPSQGCATCRPWLGVLMCLLYMIGVEISGEIAPGGIAEKFWAINVLVFIRKYTIMLLWDWFRTFYLYQNTWAKETNGRSLVFSWHIKALPLFLSLRSLIFGGRGRLMIFWVIVKLDIHRGEKKTQNVKEGLLSNLANQLFCLKKSAKTNRLNVCGVLFYPKAPKIISFKSPRRTSIFFKAASSQVTTCTEALSWQLGKSGAMKHQRYPKDAGKTTGESPENPENHRKITGTSAGPTEAMQNCCENPPQIACQEMFG